MMRIINNKILDGNGRTLILRGVNLGGDAKNPFGPPGWGMRPESLKNPADASFIGRPFPPEEAENHFERLNRAGMTFLRLVITWEALEHSGPGLYDEAFLAYLRKILLIAEKKGILVFIDPHQDVWSRWTGGDGAPAWTLERIGINLDKLDTTGAAITRQRYAELHGSKPYPRMMWPSNYNRYAAATMFSLFFGGKTYAPDLILDGENVQDWLQNHYIAAFRHCFRRLKNCAAIAGWGIMNEPHNGFIGHNNLEQAQNPVMPVGPRPSPWEAMRSASGYTTKVPIFNAVSFGKQGAKHEVFNPVAHSLFKEGFSCPWKQAGVWTDEDGSPPPGSAPPPGGAPRLLRKDHFARYDGRQVHFLEDFHKPFSRRFITAMREVREDTFFFLEGLPSGSDETAHLTWGSPSDGGADDPPNVINAFHWYDGLALFTKQFKSWLTMRPAGGTQGVKLILGRKNVQAHFSACLKKGVQWSEKHMGNIPSLLGEFGLAFDMNNRRAFRKSRAFPGGDYSLHEEALSMYYNAVDENLLHSTIWNYTADNTNAYGDGWNDEDLSIYSEGTERAAAGWKRPYPMATAGTPLSFTWNYRKGVFRYRFNADSAITEPTIIYLPTERFGPSPRIEINDQGSGGKVRFEYRPEEQRLFVYNDGFNGEVEVEVEVKSRR